MFENILRELKRLERGAEIRVPIEPDERGYLDKQCPKEDCLFIFKVMADDWKDLFADEAVYCPYCRVEAPADHWWTSEQLDHAKEQAFRQVKGRIDGALRKDAHAFNRRQRPDGFIRMSMSVSGPRSHSIVIPAPAREALELEIACEKCHARFAVIGAAYFCPCCGFNSVERTFDDSIRKVLAKVDNIGLIREALVQAGQRDEAELTCRSLIESGLQDCVVAFQRLAEALWPGGPGVAAPRRNAFQNLHEGSALWQAAVGKAYGDWLPQADLDLLNILFQKRHLLAHREGIVDDDYRRKSCDTTYEVGQRIVISDADVRTMVDLVTRLSAGIRASVA